MVVSSPQWQSLQYGSRTNVVLERPQAAADQRMHAVSSCACSKYGSQTGLR